MKTYFYQGGSLPGVGTFPAGVVVTTDDTTGTVISVETSLATPPIDPQPTPVFMPSDVPPLQSSSRQAAAPAPSPNKENGG